MIAYYSLYIYDFKFDALGQARRIFIIIAVSLLLFVGFIFTNNMTLMMQPEQWSRYFFNPFGTLLNLQENMVIPRFLHFVVGSIAIAGLFQAVLWEFRRKKNLSNIDEAVGNGMKWFMGATSIQIMIGIWFLLSLPADKMMLFLGKDFLRTFLLAAGIICIFFALYSASQNKVWTTLMAALSTVIIMVFIRDLLRMSWIKPFFSPASLKVEPQYSSLILFLIAFVIGFGIIVYMLKIAASAGKEN
jgi:hypothetical protein